MENIRNFSIIAHIDHGKSTLADRFLELTETIPKEKMKPQYLDTMDLEREKGITIKMQPVRMLYRQESNIYNLNLIDTPGHVDFNYEVSRSLAAVEGAILLVDAIKGVQAQTLANLDLAKRQGLVIIPVINKIDLSIARIEETVGELANLLKIEKNEIFKISAKYGTGIQELLEILIKKIPPPKGNQGRPLKALIFDSEYDPYKGIIAFVRVVDGEIGVGKKIYLMATKTEGLVKEIGFFKPELSSTEKLVAGEIGYIATGVKEAGKVRVGDTITTISSLKSQISNLMEPLPGYKEPQSMVFASVYPENPDDFDLLKDALYKLKLSDAALAFEPESQMILGRGFRCGFLGSLHVEIVSERLRREFGLNLIISIPQVVYKILDNKDKEAWVYSSSQWPDFAQIKKIQEPWVRLKIITPTIFFSSVLKLLENTEAKSIETQNLSQDRLLLIYEVPLREIIVDFYDRLKGGTQGFASMNYEVLEYRPADLIKLEILILGKKEEAFSKIVPRNSAFKEGKKLVEKLKEVLPTQLFSVPIQAAIGGKIIARETIKAKRKDVTAPLYGGDFTRKRKLLEIQKKGKKKLKERGKIRIPTNVYLKMFTP